jgi:hypothetical protein
MLFIKTRPSAEFHRGRIACNYEFSRLNDYGFVRWTLFVVLFASNALLFLSY